MSDNENLYDKIIASGVDPHNPVGVIVTQTDNDEENTTLFMKGTLLQEVPDFVPNPEEIAHLSAFVVSCVDDSGNCYIIGLEVADVPPVPIDNYGLMLVVPDKTVHIGQGEELMAQVEAIEAGALGQLM